MEEKTEAPETTNGKAEPTTEESGSGKELRVVLENVNKTGEENAKKGPEDEDKDGHESPIHLTLEDDDGLHEEEPEANEKGDEEAGDKKKNDEAQPDVAATENNTADKEKTQDQQDDSIAGAKTEEKDSKDDAYRRKPGEKLQKKVGAKSNPNVVWVSNLAQNTRASELKAALSACGKVSGAKVVVNARYPGSNCFGYVTMGSIEDVENVISKLNNTELNGHIIKIEKFDQVRADQIKQMKEARAKSGGKKDDKRSDSKHERDRRDKDRKEKESKKDDATKTASDGTEEKKDGEVTAEGENEEKDKENKESNEDGEANGESQEKSGSKERQGSKERKNSREKSKKRDNTRSKSRISRDGQRKSRSRERNSTGSLPKGRRNNVLTFDKIREERERQRLREKERILREEARRRHEQSLRQRDIERRQRSEAARLEREKEKLRIEKERIDREKAELVRMERERQRLEREKLALEKMQLERTLLRLEEDRRAAKRSANRDEPYDDRKRPAPPERHFDAPPPPRFEPPPSVKSRDLTTKKFTSSSKDAYSKSRPVFDKHEVYPEKHGRDYDGPPSGGRYGSSSSAGNGKYDRGFDNRDSRGDPHGRVVSPQSRSKDSRFPDRDRSPHFRPSIRDERRPPAEIKPDIPMSSRSDRRYESSNEPPRFDRNSANWSSMQKPFSVTSSSKPWVKDDWRPAPINDRDRWNSGSQPGSGMGGRPFAGNSGSNMTPVCPPPPGINSYQDSRFSYGKPMGSSRKY